LRHYRKYILIQDGLDHMMAQKNHCNQNAIEIKTPILMSMSECPLALLILERKYFWEHRCLGDCASDRMRN